MQKWFKDYFTAKDHHRRKARNQKHTAQLADSWKSVTVQIVWLFYTLFTKFCWALLLVSSSDLFLLGRFFDHCVFYVLQLVWESSRYVRLYERISKQFLWFIYIWKWSNLINLDSSRYFLEMCWKCLLLRLNELSCSVGYFSSP